MNRMKANDAYIKRLSFGRAIRKFRERKNMSQEDLALSAQMDRSYVGRVERGEKSVSLDKIWQLCTALEATPAELLSAALVLEQHFKRLGSGISRRRKQ